MNSYFYKIWLPIQLLTIIGFVLLFNGIFVINWWVIFVSWFFIGPLGLGVGFHRLFSHRQFETWKVVEYALAILGTLSAYGPILFWVSNHQLHHIVSDTNKDMSSPKQYGFIESFFTFRMRKTVERKIHLRNYCSKRIMSDKFLMYINKNFIIIIWSTIVILLVINFSMLFNLFLVPVLIEHIRINCTNSLLHIKLPFSYRNFDTKDNSYNNILFDIFGLGLGFGLHNNHHHNPRKVNNRVKWWEFDIEGTIAGLLSK
jgi:fatty-acid desaturase